MRVITGKAKGRKLITVEGTDVVRPTTDKIKEAIFSAIQFEIEGSNALDLFAGSGQLGIEAISRGADKCVFVDSAAVSVNTIKQNLQSTGLAEQGTVVHMPFSAFLKSTKETFDIALLDPPYRYKLVQKALPLVCEKMSDNGVIVCEHEKECVLPATVGKFKLVKLLNHGTVSVSIYRQPDDEDEEEE